MSGKKKESAVHEVREAKCQQGEGERGVHEYVQGSVCVRECGRGSYNITPLSG